MATTEQMAARIAELEAMLVSRIKTEHAKGISLAGRDYDGVNLSLGVGAPIWYSLAQAQFSVEHPKEIANALAQAVAAPPVDKGDARERKAKRDKAAAAAK